MWWGRQIDNHLFILKQLASLISPSPVLLYPQLAVDTLASFLPPNIRNHEDCFPPPEWTGEFGCDIDRLPFLDLPKAIFLPLALPLSRACSGVRWSITPVRTTKKKKKKHQIKTYEKYGVLNMGLQMSTGRFKLQFETLRCHFDAREMLNDTFKRVKWHLWWYFNTRELSNDTLGQFVKKSNDFRINKLSKSCHLAPN